MKSLRASAVVVLVLISCMLATWPEPVQASEVERNEAPIIVTYSRDDVVSPRAWFGTSMVLYTTYATSSHYFDGNSVGIEMTCASVGGGTFNVTLRRVQGNSSVSIGTAAFRRNVFTKATWEGVGAGTYFFVMSKPTDGTRVTSSDVAMYSW